MKKIILSVFFTYNAFGQFAPPAGQTGSTAIYKDSSVFVSWASAAKISRGLQDISSASSGYASVGDSTSPVAKADGSIVSLGDGGSAICTFTANITNGQSYDFAVFENAFNDTYLELAFVEVSSDGVNFFRFPATSNTQDTAQTGGFGSTDATKLNNLAGKYRANYGTPFDLSDLQGTAGLDINNITHVKVMDVVGSINPAYATYDKNGNKVNDPWPTSYTSGGFDLDAIGVIHQSVTGIKKENTVTFHVYPNPATDKVFIHSFENALFSLKDVKGRMIGSKILKEKEIIDVSVLENGIYFLEIKNESSLSTQKLIIAH